MHLRLLSLLLCLSLLTTARPALADTAPLAALGPNLQPIDSTTVRLESERIEIDVRRAAPEGPAYVWSAVANYRVVFHFAPTADEAITAGFPLFVIDQATHRWGAPVQNIRIVVDGQAVPTETKSVWYGSRNTEWAVFPVTFRKGQPLTMAVTYSLPVTPKTEHGGLFIGYILRTGAFWAGTIGRAEAVLRMDKPIREEDLPLSGEGGITPGWRLADGVLSWEWADLEPDFDLSVVMANPYWLDTPADIRSMLDAGVKDRETLLQVAHGVQVLFDGDGKFGNWMKVRGGISSEKAAEPLVEDVAALLEAEIKANPKNWELRQRYLRLLLSSAWHESVESGVLVSQERLQRTLVALRQYESDGGPSFHVANARPWLHRDMATFTLTDATQTAIGQFLAQEIEQHHRFSSEAMAREWVRSNAGTALSPTHEADLLKVALARVTPAEPSAPASAGAQPGSPASAGAQPASPAAPETPATAPEARPGWLLWSGGAALLLVVAGGALWRRRSR